MCLSILGKILITAIWVILAKAIVNSRIVYVKYSKLMSELQEYMDYKRLPVGLRHRFVEYYNYKFGKKYIKEEYITQLLSKPLQAEVKLHIYGSFIKKVPIFSELSEAEIGEIASNLKSNIYLTGDIIFQSKTYTDEMYFLVTGTVAIYTHSGKEICHLEDGAFFGEVALVMHEVRQVSAIALETSKLYKLEKQVFERTIKKNTAVYKKILRDVKHKIKKIRDLENEYKDLLYKAELVRH